MLENINPENILFLDIETVPMTSRYEDLPDPFKGLWDKKAEQLLRNDKIISEEKKSSAEIYQRAGIYAEFGKIICISTGVLRNQSLWIKSFYGDNEKELLLEFADMLGKAHEKQFRFLCAHNGKEFDYPYLIRRMLINGVKIPSILDLSGKKPWEVNHFDTMELWKFGDYKNYTSLELLAALFCITTPKDDIDGSDVAKVYWEEHDLHDCKSLSKIPGKTGRTRKPGCLRLILYAR
jgi:DNA polymerase elongation subunit (family B)